MKTWLLLAGLSSLPWLLRAEDAPPGGVRQRLLEKMIQSAPPLPAAAPRVEPKEHSDDVVMMDRFTVTERNRQPELNAAVEEGTQKRRNAEYSIVRGGALFKKDIGKARIEVGTWGTGAGLNLLRISW